MADDLTELNRLLPEIYGELRRLAAAALRREGHGHTLQPTALVNEAYLRLARSPGLQILDRRQFLAIAARVMRQVLVEHARARQRTTALSGMTASWRRTRRIERTRR